MKQEAVQQEEIQQDNRILDTAMYAGSLLLQNGAEIYRVEDTMHRICHHYGVESGDFFVLSNGIITTGGHGTRKAYARVSHIPMKTARLDKVIAVNQLSREIAEGCHPDIESVEQRLRQIDALPDISPGGRMLASGVGSAAFCALFGGSTGDCLSAFLAGYLVLCFITGISERYFSKIIGNICSGMVISLVCILSWEFGIGRDVSSMLGGAIVALIPGVAITNGVRDMVNENYMAGSVRLLDAGVAVLGIALGVGVIISFYRGLGGSFFV